MTSHHGVPQCLSFLVLVFCEIWKVKFPLIYIFVGVFDKIWVKFRPSFQLYVFIIFTCELPSQLSVSVSRQLRVKSGLHLQYLKIWPLTFHSNINQANHVFYNCAMLNCYSPILKITLFFIRPRQTYMYRWSLSNFIIKSFCNITHKCRYTTSNYCFKWINFISND